MKRSSPQKKSWRNQGKREVNWEKKVIRVTQGSTEAEVKLPEVKNTREGAERAESQAVQM